MIEATHTDGECEVMVHYDEITHQPQAVYWYAQRPLQYSPEDGSLGELPYREGQNPMFHHAVDVDEAMRIVKRDLNVASGCLEEHPWLAEYEY